MDLMQKLRAAARRRELFALFAILAGVAAFLIIYGAVPLDVTNDIWLIHGYDESDILQSYAGWLAYRQSPWDFPLGMASQMPGTIISFTDSIPWAAVFFKFFHAILPETFQYYGLYELFCFMMQGLAGYLLLEYKTKNRLYSLIGSVLFSFAPIMIERAFRHPALSSHWLILFSILVYFRHRDAPHWSTWLFLGVLETLAIGIHPYFLPLTACFTLLCAIEDCRRHEWKSVLWLLGVQAATLAVGYCLGAVGFGGVEVEKRDPYGIYSLNLNALINPSSLGANVGDYRWSMLLPKRNQTLGNYDGFNYLGLGILLALPILLALWLAVKGWRERGGWKLWLHRNLWLLLAALGMTVYAVSNVVTLEGEVLFEYPLPKFLQPLCNMFRASGRMFYPVGYLIFLAVLLLLWKCRDCLKKQYWVYAACALICAVQIWDMRDMIEKKHAQMDEAEPSGMVLYVEPVLIEAAQRSQYFFWDGSKTTKTRDYAVWALKSGLIVYDTAAIGGDQTAAKKEKQELIELILQTGDLHGCMIATADEETYYKYRDNCNNVAAWDCESVVYLIFEHP